MAAAWNEPQPSECVGETIVPTRFWIILVLAIVAGIAVTLVRPAGRTPRSSAPWRGQIKPPPPPP